jgi:hypothetical protein
VLLAEQIGAQDLALSLEQDALLDPEGVCSLTLETPREVDG